MKGRITFWVTCVCLVCCIAFTAIHTHATLNQLTVSATDDLLRICRLSAEYLDNAAFSPSEEKSAVTSLGAEMEVGMMVLYYYSKESIPGCTRQGCPFARNHINFVEKT